MKKLLTVLMLTLSISLAGASVGWSQTCGDVNGDTVVSVVDALMVAQHAAQLITIPVASQACADVDSSGQINILDALVIAQNSAGVTTNPLTCTQCPADQVAFIDEDTSEVIVFDTATNTEIAASPFAIAPTGSVPFNLTASFNGQFIYTIDSSDGTIVQIDLNSNTVASCPMQPAVNAYVSTIAPDPMDAQTVLLVTEEPQGSSSTILHHHCQTGTFATYSTTDAAQSMAVSAGSGRLVLSTGSAQFGTQLLEYLDLPTTSGSSTTVVSSGTVGSSLSSNFAPIAINQVAPTGGAVSYVMVAGDATPVVPFAPSLSIDVYADGTGGGPLLTGGSPLLTPIMNACFDSFAATFSLAPFFTAASFDQNDSTRGFHSAGHCLVATNTATTTPEGQLYWPSHTGVTYNGILRGLVAVGNNLYGLGWPNRNSIVILDTSTAINPGELFSPTPNGRTLGTVTLNSPFNSNATRVPMVLVNR